MQLPAAKCSITLERLALPEQHKEAAEKIPLAQRWIEDGAGTDEAIFGRLQRVERPQRRRVGIGVGYVVGRGSESGSGAGCCRKASQSDRDVAGYLQLMREKVAGNWRVRHVRAHAEKRASRAEWSLDELGNDAAGHRVVPTDQGSDITGAFRVCLASSLDV